MGDSGASVVVDGVKGNKSRLTLISADRAAGIDLGRFLRPEKGVAIARTFPMTFFLGEMGSAVDVA
eukprot:scaffold21095_cov92-Amphora_coffeaeformis.AAC.3